MAGRLAILAGAGKLPQMLVDAQGDALCVAFKGVAHDVAGPVQDHSFEQMGVLFDSLKSQGVDRVVFAGAMSRPALDPSAFDSAMMALAPRLLAAFQQGDDALLRLVIAVFEEQGFAVMGAHELLPGLVAEPGLLAGPEPSKADIVDATRAGDILLALSPLDIGQGAVVAGGQCLGIETVQGTDAMLAFVAASEPAKRGTGGVFVKAAKRGQELRVDMPAIGPDTATAAAKAGLAGVVIEAGRVMILDRAETLARFEAEGIFLSAQEL